MTIYSEPEERKAQLSAFLLEHTATQTKREVIVLSGDDTKESPSYAGRVQPRGNLASLPVNVTISQLQHTDTGLYTSTFIYKDSTGADKDIKGHTQLFLYVKVAGVYIFVSTCLACLSVDKISYMNPCLRQNFKDLKMRPAQTVGQIFKSTNM